MDSKERRQQIAALFKQASELMRDLSSMCDGEVEDASTSKEVEQAVLSLGLDINELRKSIHD